MPASDKVNILVVDDLADKILVVQTVLEELGENIIIARSGEEALQKVLEHEFAVILLDVHMPGMDGYETAAYIRRRKRSAHTPIIFITAYADHVQTTEGYTLGAVDFIFSPVVPEILRTKVKVFVNLFRMTQQVRQQADERVALAREQMARLAAEEATRRFSFLAEAGAVLSSSLDVETTQRNVARLMIPFLADVAGVTVRDNNGSPGRTELAWVTEADLEGIKAKTRWQSGRLPAGVDGMNAIPTSTPHTALEYARVPPSLRHAIEQVLRSRKIVRLQMEDCRLPIAEVLGQQVELENGQSSIFDLQSAIILPLAARGHSLGALTLGLGLSGRRLEDADLALAEDLAGRAATALDNAQLHQNIQDNDRRKNEFLVMLAHELRNPLAPIRNSVEVLRLAEKTQPLMIEASEMIGRQVTHLARLIDDLLDMSRLTHGKILLRKQRLDLVEVVRSATNDYRPILEQAGLQFAVQLSDHPLYVEGDSTRLAQIVGNVLHNANKFTDPGGQVTVAVSEKRAQGDSDIAPVLPLTSTPTLPYAIISIHDSGIGMEPRMLARIFETFSQADTSLDRNRGGLGLGLALVKGLVQLHDGDVRAYSAGLGKGTEVVIRLPLARSSAPPPQQQPGLSEKPGLSAQRILIIEDNRDAAESMRLLLALTGHQVAVANAGLAGIATARSFHPDIVLCDIGLPAGMDGYAVAQAFRADPTLARSRLVALTGYGQEQDQRRSREVGFDAHLVKPVDFTELEQLLAKLGAEE